MYKLISLLFLIVFSASSSRAELINVTPDDDKNKPLEVNIYFSSEVNNKSVSELGAALSSVAINYPSVKKINMIVNSPGGSVKAGQLGYMLVKSSQIPVHAINVALTASAASWIFCGAKERTALPGAFFLLHPAALDGYSEQLKPDVLQRLTQQIDEANEFSALVYKQCTNLSENEIAQINKAEYFAKYIGVAEASDIKLIDGVQENIPEAGASYFIHDEDSN